MYMIMFTYAICICNFAHIGMCNIFVLNYLLKTKTKQIIIISYVRSYSEMTITWFTYF